MKCENCGTNLSEESLFCASCGTKVSETKSEKTTDETATAKTKTSKAKVVETKPVQNIENVHTKQPDTEPVKTKFKYSKNTTFNIVAFVISIILLIFSMLPLYTVNIGSRLGYDVDPENDIKVSVSAFNYFSVVPELFGDKTSQEYEEELIETLLRDIDPNTFSKLAAGGKELTSRERSEFITVLNNYNMMKVIAAAEMRYTNIASLALFFLYILLLLGAIVMPVILIVFSVLGIFKNKIFGITKFSFIIFIALYAVLLFFSESQNMFITKYIYQPLSLIFAFFGFIFAFLFGLITNKEKLPVRAFLKKAISSSIAVLFILLLSSSAIAVNYLYEEDKYYSDGEDYSSFIVITDGILNYQKQYIDPEDINEYAEDIEALSLYGRIDSFSIENSLKFALNQDMKDNYYAVLIISTFEPFTLLGTYGVILSVLILNFLSIQLNRYKNKDKTLLLSIIGGCLYLLTFALSLPFIVGFNEGAQALGINSFMSFTAWPFVCITVAAGLLLHNIMHKTVLQKKAEIISEDEQS